MKTNPGLQEIVAARIAIIKSLKYNTNNVTNIKPNSSSTLIMQFRDNNR